MSIADFENIDLDITLINNNKYKLNQEIITKTSRQQRHCFPCSSTSVMNSAIRDQKVLTYNLAALLGLHEA